jgi:hypothetical protein
MLRQWYNCSHFLRFDKCFSGVSVHRTGGALGRTWAGAAQTLFPVSCLAENLLPLAAAVAIYPHQRPFGVSPVPAL